MGLQRTHSYPCNVTEHDALEHIHFFNKTFSPSFLFSLSTICLLLRVGALRLLFRETTIFWEVESCVEHSVTLRTQYAFMTETMTPFLHPKKITEHRTSSIIIAILLLRKQNRTLNSKRAIAFARSRSSTSIHLVEGQYSVLQTKHIPSKESQVKMEFSGLSSDMQIEVFSFLDLDSLRKIMATNRVFRFLLVSDAAYRLWLFQLELCWGKLPGGVVQDTKNKDPATDLVLRNDVPVPFASRESILQSSSTVPFKRLGKTNLPLLLATKPEKIGKSLLLYSSVYSYHRPGLVFDVSTNKDALLEYSSDFTNYVYSIRASHPLAKPKVILSEVVRQNEMELDEEEEESDVEKEYTYQWRPFVVPYRCQPGPSNLIHVSPRLVSYYEITIEEREWEGTPPTFRDDCVCIGLSTSLSRWVSRLPGWDKLSYGYHGDNGGLYHGTGRNIGLVGTFGLGDTVGMGVDYVNRHIFVTKNGQFVTVAFPNLSAKMLSRTHLLPVIGLYTRHSVAVNYGGMAKPFAFDLAAYCNHDQKQFGRSSQVPMEVLVNKLVEI